MSFKLNDIFLGDHPVVENFGSDPATYSARYNIQGYPGIRVKMDSLTPILAGADGFVFEVGFEEAGKGKFITLKHDGFLTTYGHLNDILVQKDEKVISGQLIAHSNQSGLTDIPCLYFGIAPCNADGTKTEDNGFGGYIDPLGDRVKWEVKNLTEPVTKAEVLDKMTLNSQEYATLNAQATNYRVVVSFLKQNTTFDEFLKEAGRVPVNLDVTPDDSTGGESINLFLNAIDEEYAKALEQREEESSESIIDKLPKVSIKTPNFVIKFLVGVKNFIFV